MDETIDNYEVYNPSNKPANAATAMEQKINRHGTSTNVAPLDDSLMDDVLLGILDADTVITKRLGKVRVSTPAAGYEYDAVESDHRRPVQNADGTYTERAVASPTEEINRSRYKRAVQPGYVANLLNKPVDTLTDQDYIDVADRQQRQLFSDLANGNTEWQEPLLRGVESANLTGEYVGEDGKTIKYIPLNLPITSRSYGTGVKGRGLAELGSADGTNITELAVNDPQQNAYYTPPQEDLEQALMNANPEAMESINVGPMGAVEKVVRAGVSGALFKTSEAVTAAPKKLYEVLGGDYLEDGSVYSKSVKSVINTMDEASKLIAKFDKEHVAPDGEDVEKFQKEVGEGFDKGNYFSTLFTAAYNNPLGAMEMAAQSYGLTKALTAKGITKVPVFAGFDVETMDEATKEFIKVHGRKPNGSELALIGTLSTVATAVDTAAGEFALGKASGGAVRDAAFKSLGEATDKLLTKAMGELPATVIGKLLVKPAAKTATLMATEGIQEGPIQQGLVELAGRQGEFDITDKDMLKEIYVNAVMGAIAGPGMAVLSTTEAAIKPAGKFLKGKYDILTGPNASTKAHTFSKDAEAVLNNVQVYTQDPTVQDIMKNVAEGKEVDDTQRQGMLNGLGKYKEVLSKELESMGDETAGSKESEKILDSIVRIDLMSRALNGEASVLHNRPIAEIDKDIESTKDALELERLKLERDIVESVGELEHDKVDIPEGATITDKDSLRLKYYGGSIGGKQRTGLLEYADALIHEPKGSALRKHLTNALKHFTASQKDKLDAFETAGRQYAENIKSWDGVTQEPVVEFTHGKEVYTYNHSTADTMVKPMQQEMNLMVRVSDLAEGKVSDETLKELMSREDRNLTPSEQQAFTNAVADGRVEELAKELKEGTKSKAQPMDEGVPDYNTDDSIQEPDVPSISEIYKHLPKATAKRLEEFLHGGRDTGKNTKQAELMQKAWDVWKANKEAGITYVNGKKVIPKSGKKKLSSRAQELQDTSKDNTPIGGSEEEQALKREQLMKRKTSPNESDKYSEDDVAELDRGYEQDPELAKQIEALHGETETQENKTYKDEQNEEQPTGTTKEKETVRRETKITEREDSSNEKADKQSRESDEVKELEAAIKQLEKDIAANEDILEELSTKYISHGKQTRKINKSEYLDAEYRQAKREFLIKGNLAKRLQKINDYYTKKLAKIDEEAEKYEVQLQQKKSVAQVERKKDKIDALGREAKLAKKLEAEIETKKEFIKSTKEELKAVKKSEAVGAQLIDRLSSTQAKIKNRQQLKGRVTNEELAEASIADHFESNGKGIDLTSMDEVIGEIESEGPLDTVLSIMDRLSIAAKSLGLADKTEQLHVLPVSSVKGFQSISRLLMSPVIKQDANGYETIDKFELDEQVNKAVVLGLVDWLSTTQVSGIKSDAEVRAMLGMDKKAPVTNEIRERIKDVDGLLTAEANSIGKYVYKYLGIKNKDATAEANNEELAPKLKVELGLLAMRLASKANLLKPEVKKKSAVFGEDSSNESITVYKLTEEGLKTKKINPLEAGIKELTDVLGVARRDTDIHLVEPKVDREEISIEGPSGDIKGTVPKVSKDAVEKQTKDSRQFNQRFVKGFDEIGEKAMSVYMGEITDVDKNVHVVRRPAVNGKNRAIADTIKYFKETVEMVKESKMWSQWYIMSNNRFGIKSNRFNWQDKKLHRHAVMDKMVDVDTNEKKTMFMLGIGQAFDVAVDKKTIKGSMEELKGILDKLDTYDNLKDAYAYLMTTDAKNEPELALLGLVEYRAYKEAENNGEMFRTGMTLETDAITSGYFLKLLQMPVFIAPDGSGIDIGKVHEELARAGLFEVKEGEETKTYGKWKEGDVQDAYEAPAKVTYEEIESLPEGDRERTRTIFKLLGESLQETISRGFMKDPFMTFNYGAALATIAANKGWLGVDNMYKMLEDAHNATDHKDRVKLLKALTELLNITNPNSDAINRLRKAYKNKDLLNFKLTLNEEKALANSITIAVEGPLTETFEKQYGDLIKATKTVNSTFAMMFKAAEPRVIKAMDKKLEEKTQATGKTATTLTTEEVNTVLAELQGVLPTFKVAFADKDTDLGVIASREKGEYEVNVDTNMDNQGSVPLSNGKKMSAYADVYKLIGSYTGGAPITVHFQDAMLQAKVLSKFNSIGIHDANVLDIENALPGTQAYNEAVIELMQTYSLPTEMLDSLNKTLNVIGAKGIEELNRVYALEKLKQNLKGRKNVGNVKAFMERESNAIEAIVSGNDVDGGLTYLNKIIGGELFKDNNFNPTTVQKQYRSMEELQKNSEAGRVALMDGKNLYIEHAALEGAGVETGVMEYTAREPETKLEASVKKVISKIAYTKNNNSIIPNIGPVDKVSKAIEKIAKKDKKVAENIVSILNKFKDC